MHITKIFENNDKEKLENKMNEYLKENTNIIVLLLQWLFLIFTIL